MRKTLSFNESSKILGEYRIPLVKMKTVKTLDGALKYANSIGYPVVLKIDSPDIVHKSDSGCVKLGIGNDEELKSEYNDMMKKAKNAKVRGVVVQEQAKGVEIIIGGKIDPQFEEVVLFGLGGIFVEIIKDFSVRVTPISKDDAIKMIKEIKGYPVLAGARGRKPVDIDSIADTIVKIARLHAKHKEIVELDLNPAFVDEHGLKVADLRMIKEVPK